MARGGRERGRFANRPYSGCVLFAVFQEETTGIAGAASDAIEQPTRIFTGLREFLQNVYHYVLGPDFIGNVIASLLVIFLGIVTYRILTHGVPRILQWRRRSRET